MNATRIKPSPSLRGIGARLLIACALLLTIHSIRMTAHWPAGERGVKFGAPCVAYTQQYTLFDEAVVELFDRRRRGSSFEPLRVIAIERTESGDRATWVTPMFIHHYCNNEHDYHGHHEGELVATFKQSIRVRDVGAFVPSRRDVQRRIEFEDRFARVPYDDAQLKEWTSLAEAAQRGAVMPGSEWYNGMCTAESGDLLALMQAEPGRHVGNSVRDAIAVLCFLSAAWLVGRSLVALPGAVIRAMRKT